jgi:glycosyltransferase involved in cell wall biosynthesis
VTVASKQRRTDRHWLWDLFCRAVGGVVRRLTLQNYRDTTRAYWPDVHGVEVHTTALVFFALRFHAFMLARVWGNAHHLRRLRRPRAGVSSPPNVLHVTSSFDLGGTQQQIKNLCTTPARLEHSTVEIFPELNYLYRRGESIQPGRYITGGLLQRAIGRVATGMSTRSPQLLQAYKLYRDLQVLRPDIVVGWGHEMCVTTFVAASAARVPHIAFCIRTFNPGYGWSDAAWERALSKAHRRMTPDVSAIITNSTPLRDDHARWIGIAPGRISVCANGIELPKLSEAEIESKRRAMREKLGIADDVKVAINVGRFSGEKGQHTIISINEALARDYGAQLVWVLCGDGPTLDAVRRQADAATMTNVKFLGRVTGVQDYLCAADIFVMPSDYEGMPNAMMEAMACGLPCVSTDCSGAIDVARDGQEALFYKVGDLAAMERHVRFLLDHPAEARAMGRRAQARLNDFSTERSLECFEQVLERSVRSSPSDRT